MKALLIPEARMMFVSLGADGAPSYRLETLDDWSARVKARGRSKPPSDDQQRTAPNGLALPNGEFLEGMLRAGVRMGQVRGSIRAVTHLGVSADDIEFAIRAATDVMGSDRGSRRDKAAAASQVRY